MEKAIHEIWPNLLASEPINACLPGPIDFEQVKNIKCFQRGIKYTVLNNYLKKYIV